MLIFSLCFPTDVAADERLKQLERWKERKALEKEKEKREKERKGVFKTGVYHPKNHVNAAPLPLAPAASTRVREVRAFGNINLRFGSHSVLKFLELMSNMSYRPE